ncbi:MAG TPA: (Fe-S)-binding protein [Anaerolineales bacterium]|nr:(Fe-S)-binding protein [Anaerolineales bacterium]
MTLSAPYTVDDLPGLNCGVCGMRSCEELAARLQTNSDLIKRCIYLSDDRFEAQQVAAENQNRPVTAPSMSAQPVMAAAACAGCASTASPMTSFIPGMSNPWRDSLGREFDFYLEHFPEEPGPREIILPHNPLITREMDIQVGDILIGRPLGMSCGCPITHCGIAMDVDKRTGVIVWCVTGPLNPRQKGFKDLGYYIAEGYEGLINEARCEIRIGMRYYFQPRMCMLQWRHSGLVNFLNRTSTGYQVRVEGLWIG